MKYLPAEVAPLAGEKGGIRMAIGCSLLRVELSDPWPEVCSIAWDKRSLTSLVMLPSPSNFGGVDLWGLAIMMVETLPRDGTFWSGSSTVGGGCESLGRQVHLL